MSQILSTLVRNPKVWEQTVFLVVYDENGGFFDHVAPPDARPRPSPRWATSRRPPRSTGST